MNTIIPGAKTVPLIQIVNHIIVLVQQGLRRLRWLDPLATVGWNN